MAAVLCTGRDSALMQTRRLLLERSGHTVIDAMSILEVEQACREHSFDVAIIGQSMATPEKYRLFDFLRQQCPATKILERKRLRNHTLP